MGYTPVFGWYDSLSFFAWAMTGTYLAFQLKTKTRVLGAFVSPLAFFIMMAASTGMTEDVRLPGILKSAWSRFTPSCPSREKPSSLWPAVRGLCT